MKKWRAQTVGPKISRFFLFLLEDFTLCALSASFRGISVVFESFFFLEIPAKFVTIG